FGHAKKLFLNTDTFPAAIVLEPGVKRVEDAEQFSFVRAFDADRKRYDLDYLIAHCSVQVPHAQLKPDRWELEDPRLNQFLHTLLRRGQPLDQVVTGDILWGAKTGCN